MNKLIRALEDQTKAGQITWTRIRFRGEKAYRAEVCSAVLVLHHDGAWSLRMRRNGVNIELPAAGAAGSLFHAVHDQVHRSGCDAADELWRDMQQNSQCAPKENPT